MVNSFESIALPAYYKQLHRLQQSLPCANGRDQAFPLQGVAFDLRGRPTARRSRAVTSALAPDHDDLTPGSTTSVLASVSNTALVPRATVGGDGP